MRISGNEPSSVFMLYKNLKSNDQKVPKQAEAKKGWCNKPTKIKSHNFRNFTIFLCGYACIKRDKTDRI